MNQKILFTVLITSLSALCYSPMLYAQKRDPDADINLWAAKPVTIDGNSAEWHEPLNNYNTATKLAFALSNDEKELYLIIESQDESTTRNVLSGGLTLNINTAGKKKDGVKINFLGMHQPPPDHQINNDSLHLTAHYPGLKTIQVSGFKNIPDGNLTLPDQNGIQIAAAFNQQRDYICELAIPLSLLNLKGDELKAIAYNIKINGGKGRDEKNKDSAEGQQGGGMRQHGGGMHGGGGGGMHGGGMHGGGMGKGGHFGGGGTGNTAKQSDFWIKYELAEPNDSYRIN